MPCSVGGGENIIHMGNLGDNDEVDERIGHKEDAAYGEWGLRAREGRRHILL